MVVLRLAGPIDFCVALLFLQMGQINRKCVRGDIDEGEWRKTGDEGVKVVGIILVLESVAWILTTA